MKKIFALLMAAVMTMSLLAGCGQKDEDNNTSSDDNTAGDSQYHIGFVVHTTSGDVMAAIEYGADFALGGDQHLGCALRNLDPRGQTHPIDRGQIALVIQAKLTGS